MLINRWFTYYYLTETFIQLCVVSTYNSCWSHTFGAKTSLTLPTSYFQQNIFFFQLLIDSIKTIFFLNLQRSQCLYELDHSVTEKSIERLKRLRRHHVIYYKRCKTFKEIIPIPFAIHYLSSFLLTKQLCKKSIFTALWKCVNKFFGNICRTTFCVSLMDCYMKNILLLIQ